MTNNADQPVTCVVGMHRSGTSCLIGSLQAAGLYLGKHSTENRYNKRGNRENPDIVAFHEAILAHYGVHWEQPPERLPYGLQHINQARAIASTFPVDQPWGFKDPRTLVILPLWQEALPNLQLIGIFRHPIAVAKSLCHRHGSRMSYDHAFNIWYYYNRKLYAEFQCAPFPILNFDLDSSSFHEKLDSLIEQLGLVPLTPGQHFFSDELRNNNSDRFEGVPKRLVELYNKLVEVSV